ncbi:MAG: DUF4349 domain-containing protein [Bacteroidia bacterium]
MKTLVTTGSLCLLLFSCGPAAEEKAKLEAQRLQNQEQSEIRTADSLAASIELNPNNPLHQNVARTARIRIEVRDCKQSNLLIEKWIAEYGGLITSSKLNNDIIETSILPFDNDSSKELRRIRIGQHIQLKLPQAHLNSLLRKLDSIAVFVEEREQTAENVGLDLLDKKLTINRLSAAESKVIKPKSEVQTLLAQDVLIDRKAQSDDALILGLKIQARVDYNEVQIELFEQEKIIQRIIPKKDSIRNEPNFFMKVWVAILDGWKMLEFIFLFVIRIWSLLLFGLIAFVLYKRFKNKI